jgi:exodeoxyribonuclease VIII
VSNENDAYHSDVSRVSNSMLSLLKDSPRKFYNRYELGKVDKPTDAMKFGSLLHCVVLEPEEVIHRFAVMPNVDGRTKEGKAIKAAFYQESQGKEIIDADAFSNATIAGGFARMHNEYAWFADNPGLIERPICFEVDGVACKAKPDNVYVEREVIWDLKSTDDASPNGFAKSVVKYGYHRQAAFYQEAVWQEYGVQCRFLFLAVEKQYPWECAVYELDSDAIRKGEEEIGALLAEYKHRKATDNWEQVWSSGVVPLSLPKFYKSGIYETSLE